MKKLFLIPVVTILMIPSFSFAQTTGNNNEDNLKVDQIKDKVASRVAELNLVEKRGIVGIVESVEENEIRLTDLNDKTRIIDVDELTKYSSEEGAFDLDDIKPGTKISTIGLYNKDSEKLLARFVNEISIPLFLNGVVSNTDDENFTFTLLTENEKKYTVDVENITKSFIFSDGELETAGFSKIPTLKNVLVIGYENPNSENRITASRVIIFPEIPKNPRIEIDETEVTPGTASKSPSPAPKE